MGVETALIAAAVVSAGASVAGGISADKASKKEANLLNDQAALAQSEAQAEAKRRANEVRKFHRKQALAFTKNGVTLEGSPLLVLDETLREGQEEVDAIVRQGTAQAKYYRESAAQARNKGRAALIGGIGSAASSAIGAYGIGKSAGMFNAGNTASAGKFTNATTMSKSAYHPSRMRFF